MAIKLIGLDLDQTLLTDQQDISSRTADALAAANDKGIFIVPVTGRPRNGLPDALSVLPFLKYCITSNGASIWELPDYKLIGKNALKADLALSVAEYIETVSLISEYFMNGHGYESELSYENTMALFGHTGLREYFEKSRTPVKDVLKLIAEQTELEEIAVQFESVACRDSAVSLLHQSYELKIVIPADCYIEIMSPYAGKGAALSQLSALLGIHKDEIMVFGDSDNDMDMFLNAGFPVAMGNASPHIKAKSSFITAGNNSDGIAIAVERFCLN